MPIQIDKMPIQVLTLKDVVTAALKAYENGTLTAQHPDKCQRLCRYELDKKYHCAVGAALTPETIQKLNEDSTLGMSVNNLVGYGYISIPNIDEKLAIETIQHAHDMWTRACACEDLEIEPARREASFLNQLKDYEKEFNDDAVNS